jgi:hypothetical protein
VGASLGAQWYSPQSDLQQSAAAGGTATVRTRPVPTGEQWAVEQIVVSTTSATAGEALVFVGDPAVSTFACGSSAGNNDTADGAPLTLTEGQWLTIQWTGQQAGSTCLARLWIDKESVGAPPVVDRTLTRLL